MHHGEGSGRKRASEVWRTSSPPSAEAGPWEPEERWVREEVVLPGAGGEGRRGVGAPGGAKAPGDATARRGANAPRGAGATGSTRSSAGHRFNVPAAVVDELVGAAGPARGARLSARLAEAGHAYERERFDEARRLLRSLAGDAPDSPTVRELNGLCLYRLGQWASAARELEAFRRLSGSFDQDPVLADCYRALGRYRAADELWEELRSASPDADLVAEGRIVAAGVRADQGDLEGALDLLSRSERKVSRPRDRHLRQWYVLGDLYERAGELPRAREMFTRVASADPDAFDVRQRLKGLH
ncbi:MAG: tetratricopeptide repeat protein [Actinomycetota bacterium]|nr:tetratricopeptide repeat protein [Actinomycetota bacterium]